MITQYLSPQVCSNVVFALLHTLWEGTFIAAGLYLFLRMSSTLASPKRYIVCLVSMVMIVAALFVNYSVITESGFGRFAANTAIVEPGSAESEDMANSPAPADLSPAKDSVVVTAKKVQAVSDNQIPQGTTKKSNGALKLETLIPYIMWGWLLGVVVMLCRAFSSAVGVSKLRRSSVDVEDPAIIGIIEEIADTIGLNRYIRVLSNSQISVPAVVGFVWPILLVPTSMLTGVSAADMRAIFAHELAHIARYDYLVNFCQMIVEAVLFFNPAMWWVSRQIRIEREAACDNICVEVTGHKLQYARLLTEFAAKIAGVSAPIEPKPAFVDRKDPSTLKERVKRIAVAAYKPSAKIPWYTSAIMIVVSLAVICGLSYGTGKGVKYAAKLLSPQERVEKITEIKKEYAPDYDAPATIVISGKVSTFDGEFPKNWRVRTVSGHTHASIGSPGCAPDSVPKTTFRGKLYPGKSYLYATCDGYAPFITELEMKQGDSIEGIQIVFDHGFDSKIKVVDEDGNGIAGAAISGSFTVANSTFGSSLKTVSGDDGTAVCEKISDWPMSVKVIASGYQKVEGYKVELKPGEVETIVLSKGTPAGGTVVSSKTGKGVGNAEFRIIQKDKPGHGYGYGIQADITAKSDDDGVFVLDTLEAGATYSIMVSSPDHRNTFVSNIGPGNMNLKIEMDPAVVVNARITGDLSKIKQGWCTVDGESVRGPKINVDCILKKVRGLYNDTKDYPVKIEDGVGYVHIKNAIGSRLEFRISGKTVYKLDIIDGKSQYDITMDTAGLAGPPEREVVVTFTAGEGMPIPEGKAWVSGQQDGDSEWYSRHAKVENGIAKFKVPVPCKMNVHTNSQDKLTGYWFTPVKDIEIDTSDEPFELEINVKPGGTIFGNVYDGQGNKLSGARMHIKLVNEVEGLDASARSRISDSIAYDAGRSGSYTAMSLPFGGKYKFEATHENYLMLSPEIKISEKKPIVQYDFNMGDSISLKGRILKHDSSAAAGVDYQLYRSSKLVSGSLGKLKTANKNGEFFIEGVNPDVKADYSLKVFDKETGRQQKFKLKCTQRSQKLKLAKPILIKGRVINADTSEGIAGMIVWANTTIKNRTDYDLRGSGITDGDGYFEVYVSSGDRYGVGIENGSLKSFHGAHASSVSTYSKRLESADENVLFEVRPGNTLSGRVVDDSTGQPIAGVKISGVLWINDSHKSIASSLSPVTDAEGKFQLPAFDGIAYEIEDIKGYYLASEKKIKFQKGERNKTVVIKVKKQ